MEVTVNVTKADIESGVRRSQCNCPVSLAIKRKVKDKVKVEVCRSVIYVAGKAITLSAENAQRIGYFAASFDHLDKFADQFLHLVKPMRVVMNIPAEYLR